MPERRRVETQGRKLELAAASLYTVFEAEWVAHADDIGAHIARDQQTTAPPQQRDVPGAVTWGVDDLKTACERQRLTVVNVLVDPHRRDRFVRAPEKAKQDSLD